MYSHKLALQKEKERRVSFKFSTPSGYFYNDLFPPLLRHCFDLTQSNFPQVKLDLAIQKKCGHVTA